MRLTCGGLGRTPQGGDLAPGGPRGSLPLLSCWGGESPSGAGSLLFTFLFLPLFHASLPALHPVLLHPAPFFCLPCPSALPTSVSLVLACPFFLFGPLGFVFRILLPGQDLSLPFCLPASLPGSFPLLPGPDSSSGPLFSFSGASSPWSPARRNPPPFGELSAQAPPLSLPLPCSPLIEMLMRLLLLPSLAGRRAPWPASAPVR